MNDAELLRASLAALAFRDHARLRSVRAQYQAHHPRGETEQLLHVAAVCVRLRFGGSGDGHDSENLVRFLAEARAARPGFTVPSNFLDVEGVIRGLLGEPGILDRIDPTSMRRILTFLVQYLADTTPEIREDFDAVIDQARQQIHRQIVG
ncbi:hypothetical protein [Glycomyces salinus]|uniref:hypothetical protein n=1 Tax=Glycomyces salinus TaxID=980294 RepID=UPI0018ED5E8E|nr:hypothetical protein [Glycomyces salinus]